MIKKIITNLFPFSLYLALAIALVSLMGSLMLSGILHFDPCELCWYQRIAMYPLVPIIYAGIIKKDTKNLPAYVLPLAIIGAALALYQTLMQWGIISEKIIQCTGGASCTTKYLNWLGFIDISFLSFLAFGSIIILMLIFIKGNNK